MVQHLLGGHEIVVPATDGNKKESEKCPQKGTTYRE
jgi:hypothetical protein